MKAQRRRRSLGTSAGIARPFWILVLVAACNGASPSSPASALPAETRTPTASATASGPLPTGATPSTGPRSDPFDPAAISVALVPVATVAGGPLAFAAPNDGSGRVLVAAKDGRIWILQGKTVVATPLLDLRELVSSGGEQGLLGLAVHPEFPADPRVFVDYTDQSGDTVVASFRLAVDDPDRLDASTEKRILEVDQPHSRHNGGALAFGPDGFLYISLGDGGGAGDQAGNAQRTDTLLGKVLRIDVDVPANARQPYAIPTGNPFAGSNSARQEIWHLGLRNPWRMSFDRSTGALWIGDVGQGAWEEIDVAGSGVGGLNFGWRVREGRHCYAPPSGCDSTGLTEPVSEYGHDLGCTVIGGAVYRGSAQPLLVGGYLFADYCSGRLWVIAAAGSGYRAPVLVGTTGGGIAAFGEDAGGELFAANLDGTISRVVATAP